MYAIHQRGDSRAIISARLPCCRISHHANSLPDDSDDAAAEPDTEAAAADASRGSAMATAAMDRRAVRDMDGEAARCSRGGVAQEATRPR